jgi:hypothetical protein
LRDNVDRLPGCSSAEGHAVANGVRVRRVGAKQRPATWACIENLIIVNWDALRVRPVDVQPCA